MTALPLTDVPTEITPLVDSFNRLMHQLDQAVQSERRFIGDAAHALRYTSAGGQIRITYGHITTGPAKSFFW